jgi:hypothetical protein
MKTRTEEQIRAKIIEITELQNWLLEVLDTKATYRERQKVRQALTSTISFIDGLRYSLGEIDNDYYRLLSCIIFAYTSLRWL